MKRVGLLLVVLAACGNKTDKAENKVPSSQLDEVNALVPASLRDKLTFVEREIKDGPYIYYAPVPKAWNQMRVSFTANDASESSLYVVAKCVEPCREPADWNAEVDKIYVEAPLPKEQVEKDERTKNSRTVLAEFKGDPMVLVARWADGKPQYLWCEAHLGKPWSEARLAP
jgi:hypothetical protein